MSGQLSRGDLAYIDGFVSHVYNNDDLPDGAWQAMQEDLIQILIWKREIDVPEDTLPNDVWHEYLTYKKEKRDDS